MNQLILVEAEYARLRGLTPEDLEILSELIPSGKKSYKPRCPSSSHCLGRTGATVLLGQLRGSGGSVWANELGRH